LYGLEANAMLNDENRFPVARPKFQPKPEVNQAQILLQIDVDDDIFWRSRMGKAFAREGFGRENPGQLTADVFGTLDRVGDDGDSIHDPARNNSSDFTVQDLTN
jgi:hypothetical protein